MRAGFWVKVIAQPIPHTYERETEKGRAHAHASALYKHTTENVLRKGYSPKSTHGSLKRRKTGCQRKFVRQNGLFGFAVQIALVAKLTNVL